MLSVGEHKDIDNALEDLCVRSVVRRSMRHIIMLSIARNFSISLLSSRFTVFRKVNIIVFKVFLFFILIQIYIIKQKP